MKLVNFPFTISSLPKRLLWMALCYLSSSSSKWLTLLQFQFFLVKAYRESSAFKNILHQQTVATEPLCFKLVHVCDFLMCKSWHFKNIPKTSGGPLFIHESKTMNNEQKTLNNGHGTVGREQWREVKIEIPLGCILSLKPCHAKKDTTKTF